MVQSRNQDIIDMAKPILAGSTFEIRPSTEYGIYNFKYRAEQNLEFTGIPVHKLIPFCSANIEVLHIGTPIAELFIIPGRFETADIFLMVSNEFINLSRRELIFMIQCFQLFLDSIPYTRIQTISSFDKAQSFLKHLGFESEGIMKHHFGKDKHVTRMARYNGV